MEKHIRKLISQIVVGILGIFLSVKFVPGGSLRIIPGQSNFFGINLTQEWQIITLVGATLGIINFFIRPILRLISFPLRLLTLGLFSLIIDIAIVWFLQVIFLEFRILGLVPLLETTLITWALGLFLY